MDQAANLRRLVLEKGDNQKKTRTIAITSGKGGVGKTSVAVSLSIALAKAGSSVTLLDADLGLANINVILGIIPKYNLYHVIKGKKKLKDIIIEVPEGIKIIAGASGFHQLANLDMKQNNIEKEYGRRFNIPIVYISELIGLALGLNPKDLGMDKHFIDTGSVIDAFSDIEK